MSVCRGNNDGKWGFSVVFSSGKQQIFQVYEGNNSED